MYIYIYICHRARVQFYRNNKRERRRANVADIYEIRRDENNYISLLHPPAPLFHLPLARYRTIENAYQTINQARK